MLLSLENSFSTMGKLIMMNSLNGRFPPPLRCSSVLPVTRERVVRKAHHRSRVNSSFCRSVSEEAGKFLSFQSDCPGNRYDRKVSGFGHCCS